MGATQKRQASQLSDFSALSITGVRPALACFLSMAMAMTDAITAWGAP